MNNRNNVCIIAFYGASWGGSWIPAMRVFAEQIISERRKCIFVFPQMAYNLPWVSTLQATGVNVHFIENDFYLKRSVKIKEICILKKIIKKNDVGYIWTHFIGYNYSLLCLKHLLGRKVQFIATYHNTFKLPSPNVLKRAVKLFILNHTYDVHMGVSENVMQSMLDNGIRGNVSYVTNGIDFKRLDTYESINLRKDNSEYLVLMFGWPLYVKGVDIALQAIDKLRNMGKKVVLVTPHHNIKNDIIDLCRGGQLIDSVRFIKSRDDVATLYNNVDCFLSASREEGYNYALREAILCNPMIVASNIPAHKINIIPECIYYNTEVVEELVESIQKAMNISEIEKQKIKEKQREYVLKNCGLDTWLQKIMEYFK